MKVALKLVLNCDVFFFNLGDEYWRRIISSDFCTKRRQGEQNFSVVTDE